MRRQRRRRTTAFSVQRAVPHPCPSPIRERGFVRAVDTLPALRFLPAIMMDKTFEPAVVEARIAARWEEAGAFRAGRADRIGAEPYAIVIPPPNVTGSLHMGHALNNTLQDVLCRFERMRGKDVLWQPGTDHAGIATQMVVERRLAAENRTDRRSMGREAFLREVWKQKEESESVILGQLRRLGASCDWSRSRFTMDEGLSRAVVKVFVQLHRDGLIYRDKRLVNWDPRFQTAISDLEVQQIEVKGQLWHIRYPIEGEADRDRKSTRLNSSHTVISYAVFCLKKKKQNKITKPKERKKRTNPQKEI